MIRKLTLPSALLAAVLSLSAYTGCTSNPVKTANQATADNKPETIAFAVFGGYVIAGELGADIRELPATPQSVKDSLKAASIATAPAAESLRDAATTVRDLRRVVASGQTCGAVTVPAGKRFCLSDMPALLDNVNTLLTDTAPKITKFTEAVAAAKKGRTP
jgi:hypothetical protein